MFRTKIYFLAVPLLLAAFFFTSCKSDYQAQQSQGQGPGRPGQAAARQVRTTAVAETPFGETVTATGTLAAYDQTTVSVKVPGRVRVISVDLGSVVSRGQVIANVDSEDYRLLVRKNNDRVAR